MNEKQSVEFVTTSEVRKKENLQRLFHTHKLWRRDREVEVGHTDFMTTLSTGHQAQCNIKTLQRTTL